MSIVLPTSYSFGVGIAREMSVSHQMQYDTCDMSKQCLSIPEGGCTYTISSDILSACSRKKQNGIDNLD